MVYLLAALVVVEIARAYLEHKRGKLLIVKQHALDKQAKSIARDSERARREAVKALEQANVAREAAALLSRRVDQALEAGNRLNG